MKIKIEHGEVVGEPLQLGHFEVRRCATGWIVNTQPFDMGRHRGEEVWTSFHAFTTWEDMIAWVVKQPRPADAPLPSQDSDEGPF